MYTIFCKNRLSDKEQKAQTPVQRRMAWSAPTEIKETRRALAIRC